jgi:hypothetical protein
MIKSWKVHEVFMMSTFSQRLFVLLFAGSFALSSSPAIAVQKLLPVSDELIVVFRILSFLSFWGSMVASLWFFIRVLDSGDIESQGYLFLSLLAGVCGFLFVLLTW